ncbi:EAL domain-containing protein [Borrelia turicatae]|uniref:Sensory box/GGDEF family protein n=1 Tax=Borrelia turicatae (strain 91E135) TaxID=314724 RepID=A0ABF7PVH1_BORT9|nr:EAL domain-containing protein [Borrelia turicatae]AAX17696.1 sensory box/GGDEF family protein [Borrelia turicatae 91E135]UPA13212.1 EAL domain-containing protein [Borrelia turicatae 91E135]
MKNPNAIVISEGTINDNDITKIKSIFKISQIVKSRKNISSEYIKQSNIKFAIIYNHKRPIDFSINMANDLKSINNIHSIIIDNKSIDEAIYRPNYIEILKNISELNDKNKLIQQKKLYYDNNNANLDFFLNLSELIQEIVIITNTDNDIIYINEKGSKELELPIKIGGKTNKISDINIMDLEKNTKIDLSYNINDIPEFKNILITDCLLKIKNNKKLIVDLFISTIAQNNIDKLITIKDISELKSKHNIQDLTIIDQQTDLYNIKGLEKLLINQIESSYKKIYLFDLDLHINTECKYKDKKANSDLKILKKITSRIMSFYSEYIFRLKDNNLIVIISTRGGEQRLISIAEEIKKTISRELKKEGLIIFKFNIGIIEVNLKEDIETKISKLKIATKISDEYKDSTPILYKDELPETILIKKQNKIFEYIVKAIKNDFFSLYYQKITPLKKDLKPKIEILTRLFDYTGTPIPNGNVFSLIDKYNLTVEVDKLVVTKALREYTNFVAKNGAHIFSINISPYSLKSKNFRMFLKETLLTSHVPLQNICLEITETGILENFELINTYFNELKTFGIKLALDDFGSGYTSLSYIKILPIDIIKIDGSFIQVINSSQTDLVIIKSIKDIADTKKIKIIAEFVSNEEILKKINEIGIDYGQGFLWHKPEPI